MSVLRYGIVSKTATYWNLYGAHQRGLYEANGLEVSTTIVGATATAIGHLIGAEIDLAGCSPDELISARLRGHDLVVIGGIINQPVSWVVARPDIHAVEDLRGRRVGVNQVKGSVSIALRAALHEVGLSAEDYEMVEAGSTPQATSALMFGHIDAAMLTAPFDFELVQQGFTALLNVADYLPHYAFTTINARKDWVRSHQAEVEGFFRATRSAGIRIFDPEQRADVLDVLANATGLSGAPLDRTYEAYLRPGVLSRYGEVDPLGLQAVIERMQEQQLILTNPPTVEELLLPSWSDQ